ncbi:MAG: RNA pseudouridine synthase [Rhodothermia bacterium]|nr:RNA pseudouridine synthase [Rhodothermia bacterium]
MAKPAGLLSQADRTGDPDLLTWCRSYIERRYNKPGRAYIGLVHRLDRPASGVMVFARTSKAAARLARQFRERTVVKRYLAWVEGSLPGAGTMKSSIRKRGKGVEQGSEGDLRSAAAVLSWRSLHEWNNRTLLEVDLQTGRKHQIRFQLAEAGHPIIGDFRYGSEIELDGRNIGLHCCYLEVDHPTRKERVGWCAMPPHSWNLPKPLRDTITTRLEGWMPDTGHS